MNCDELLPNYLLYAMGTMEEPDLSEIRAHLARGCETCAAGVRAARAFAYSMGAVLEGQKPSQQLRERVLAIPDAAPKPRLVMAEDRARAARPRLALWFRPMPVWLGSAVAAACVLLALIPGLVWRRELSKSNAAQSAAAAGLAREQRTVAALREQASKLERTSPGRSVARAQAVPIFPLEMVRGGSPGEATQTLTIPRGIAAIILALPIDLVQRASAAELRNGSDQNVWTASPLLSGGYESVGLTIPAELLPAGRYSVLLRAGGRTIGRVPFVVVTANRPGE